MSLTKILSSLPRRKQWQYVTSPAAVEKTIFLSTFFLKSNGRVAVIAVMKVLFECEVVDGGGALMDASAVARLGRRIHRRNQRIS